MMPTDKQVSAFIRHCDLALAELGADIALDDDGNVRTWGSRIGYITVVETVPPVEGEPTKWGGEFADRVKVVIQCPECGAHRQYRGEKIDRFLHTLRDNYMSTGEHRTMTIDLTHLDAAII